MQAKQVIPSNDQRELPQSVDVLVVGAGSVGLLSTLLLRRHGLDAVSIDSSSGPSRQARATVISPRSIEILREAVDGSLELTRKRRNSYGRVRVQKLPDLQDWGHPALEGTRKASDTLPYTGEYASSQLDVDRSLLGALAKYEMPVFWETALQNFECDSLGVTAEVERMGVRERVRCSYILGADGAHSLVRSIANIESLGPGYIGTPIARLDFKADLSKVTAGYPIDVCAITEHNALLLSLDGGHRWSLNVPVDGGSLADGKLSTDQATKIVETIVGPVSDMELGTVSRWRARVSISARFAAKRTFLVGDSAHVSPPVGGFGLNLGLAGAHNLAWKLAGVVNGNAHPRLLETYESERWPVAHYAVKQGLLRTRYRACLESGRLDASVCAEIYRQLDDWHVVDSGAVYGQQDDLRPRPSTFVESLAELNQCTLGARVPFAEVDGASTLDLGRGHWRLFCGDGCRAWQQAASDLGLSHWQVTADWIAPGGAVLVRPDAHVAAIYEGSEANLKASLLACLASYSWTVGRRHHDADSQVAHLSRMAMTSQRGGRP